MSNANERAAVGQILAGFTACRVVWPNPGDSVDQIPTAADAVAAGAYVVVEIEQSSNRLASMRGLRQIDGEVRCWVWGERGVGDNLVEERADQIAALFDAATVEGWTFFPALLGAGEIDADWYGRLLTVPFTRFEGRPS